MGKEKDRAAVWLLSKSQTKPNATIYPGGGGTGHKIK